MAYWVRWKGSNRPSGTQLFSGDQIPTTKEMSAMTMMKARIVVLPGKAFFTFAEGFLTSR